MIIAFSAKARSGKTAAAKAIQAKNKDFVIVSFATPLKKIAMDHFDLTPEDIENKDKVLHMGRMDMTVRELLIQIGLMYRCIDPDFWVKRFWKEAEKAIAEGKNILVDDMRFRNEADFLAAKGAYLVRINRPGVKLIDDISEKDLDHYRFEFQIDNTETLAEHERKAVAVLTGILYGELKKAEAPLP